jgi:heat shock protein 4
VTNSSLDKSIVESYRELESQINATDKLVMDTEVNNLKNALEEYMYDTRGKLEGKYALYDVYVKAEEKQKLLTALSEAEDWLYTEEGEDAIKSAYVSRLDALIVLRDPITFRCKEVDERKRSTVQLRETINTYMSQATSTDEKYKRTSMRKQSVVEKVATIQRLEDQTARQSERAINVDLVLTSAEIEKKRDELWVKKGYGSGEKQVVMVVVVGVVVVGVVVEVVMEHWSRW